MCEEESGEVTEGEGVRGEGKDSVDDEGSELSSTLDRCFYCRRLEMETAEEAMEGVGSDRGMMKEREWARSSLASKRFCQIVFHCQA